jgi:phthalate 4,5-dioxygenase oxygenase subunit
MNEHANVLQLTGPGTPGGDLLRRYWQPVGLTKNFRDDTPQPVALMGEDLVLYRNDRGEICLVGRRCAHRRVDLAYARIEDGGLRCPYHGWLYGKDGSCLEQPGEPGGGPSRHLAHIAAYPVVEFGDAFWAYLGPGEPPVFPNYGIFTGPQENRYARRWYSECNYLQASEGNIDPVHTSFLHRYDPQLLNSAQSSFHSKYRINDAPKLSVKEKRYGIRITALRENDGSRYLRTTNFIMPNGCAIGGAETQFGRGGYTMVFHVPIDDVSHWRYEFKFHRHHELPREHWDREADKEKLPGDGDRMRRNPDNRYEQDRSQMDRTYLGMGTTFAIHDLWVTKSQGPIHDQSLERLATTDVAIGRARKMLREAIDQIARGEDPPNVIRDPAANDYSDLLVLSDDVPEGLTVEEYYAQVEGEDIYALRPAASVART